MQLSKKFIFTLSAAVLWALLIIGTKVILNQGENIYNLLFWSTLLAAPFWFWRLAQKKGEIKKLTRKDYLLLLLMGLISSVGISIIEILAIKYSSAVNYSFLIRTVTLFTFVFAYFFLGEKFTKKKVFLGLLLFVGAYLLATEGKLINLTLGDVFTLIEAALIALGNNVLGKIATNRMSSSLSSSASTLIGLLPKLVISILLTQIVWPQNPLLLASLTFISVVLTVVLFKAYKEASASYITMMFTLTPVFVSFMAIPLLGESMSVLQIVGALLIVLTGVLVEKLKI